MIEDCEGCVRRPAAVGCKRECVIKYIMNRSLHTRSEIIDVQPKEVKLEEANNIIFTPGR